MAHTTTYTHTHICQNRNTCITGQQQQARYLDVKRSLQTIFEMQSKIWNTCCNLWEYHNRKHSLLVDACTSAASIYFDNDVNIHVVQSKCCHSRLLSIYILGWIDDLRSSFIADVQKLIFLYREHQSSANPFDYNRIVILSLKRFFFARTLFAVESVLNAFHILMHRRWIQCIWYIIKRIPFTKLHNCSESFIRMDLKRLRDRELE